MWRQSPQQLCILVATFASTTMQNVATFASATSQQCDDIIEFGELICVFVRRPRQITFLMATSPICVFLRRPRQITFLMATSPSSLSAKSLELSSVQPYLSMFLLRHLERPICRGSRLLLQDGRCTCCDSFSHCCCPLGAELLDSRLARAPLRKCLASRSLSLATHAWFDSGRLEQR